MEIKIAKKCLNILLLPKLNKPKRLNMKIKIKILLICIVFLGLSSCATRPDKIQPTAIFHDKNSHLTCSELYAMSSKNRKLLKDISKKENSKADTDFWMVFWFGFPSSYFTGDYEKQIADTKGKLKIIDIELLKNKCPEEARIIGKVTKVVNQRNFS